MAIMNALSTVALLLLSNVATAFVPHSSTFGVPTRPFSMATVEEAPTAVGTTVENIRNIAGKLKLALSLFCSSSSAEG